MEWPAQPTLPTAVQPLPVEYRDFGLLTVAALQTRRWASFATISADETTLETLHYHNACLILDGCAAQRNHHGA